MMIDTPERSPVICSKELSSLFIAAFLKNISTIAREIFSNLAGIESLVEDAVLGLELLPSRVSSFRPGGFLLCFQLVSLLGVWRRREVVRDHGLTGLSTYWDRGGPA